jgi:hypothetical protein
VVVVLEVEDVVVEVVVVVVVVVVVIISCWVLAQPPTQSHKNQKEKEIIKRKVKPQNQ